MSRLVKYHGVLAGFLFLTVSAFSQLSTTEMISYGDNAFEQKNYASAIHFYEMIVADATKVARVSSHPYSKSFFTGESKKTKASQNVEAAFMATINESDENQLKMDPSEIYATHKIAECARLINDYEKAEDWYVKSLQLVWTGLDDWYLLDQYWYAAILMNNRDYASAQTEFNNFIMLHEDSTDEKLTQFVARAKAQIENCKFAQSKESQGVGFSILKGDSMLNDGSTTFAASYFDDDHILVSSARKSGLEDKDRDISSEYLSDIFVMQKNGQRWDGAEGIIGDLNTENHEAAASMGSDKKTMYFSRWDADNETDPSIYVSKYFVNKWMKGRKLGKAVNVDGFQSIHPNVSNDGTKLFFASDRPGGQGGLDIWYCTIDNRGKVSEPVNMGPEINSDEDEITPFFHEASGMLYFSSTGHQNLGGFDIFKSSYNFENKTGSTPVNLGTPINSARNDKYFSFSDTKTNGFLTSNRRGCIECENNNCNEIYTVKKEANQFLVKGYVRDSKTFEPLPNAKLIVEDIFDDIENQYITADSTGYFEYVLNPEKHVFIKAKKLEYFVESDAVSTIAVDDSEEFNIDFFLEKIPYEEIVIPGILYDYDKATLRPESKVVIDSLVTFLNLNDNLIIEISSHTDEVGSHAYNNKLSQERAESVVDYLIEKNIPVERLIAKGYGKTIPVVANSQSKEDDQTNRRTSFRILGQDFQEVKQFKAKEK